MWNVFGRTLARYYLSLRMSAALALPELVSTEIPIPTPIVRQLPSRVHGGWDERELIHHGDSEWVVVRDVTSEPQSSIVWN
jgi:hypothetical protein